MKSIKANRWLLSSLFLLIVTAWLASCIENANGSANTELGVSLPGGEDYSSPVSNATATLTLHEFVDWCRDGSNGLVRSQSISEMRYSLAFMPSAYMAFLELRTENYDYADYLKAREHYADMAYFNFRMEVPDKAGELLKYDLASAAEYEQRVKYLSFGMQQDLYLVQNGDTLLSGLYQFERAFEVVPYATVLFGFDLAKFHADKEFTIVYNDLLFDKGYVKFNYRNGQLLNIPNISGL